MVDIDSIEVINLIPKFLKFYEKANVDGLTQGERWTLWEKHYNFGAIPPGEEGRKLARSLLDKAWYKYLENIELIRTWKPNQERVAECLTEVKALLGYSESINFVVVYFVGAFEKNPFVAPYDEKRLALCLPIENGNSAILLAHELTHIVHSKTADITAGWERTIACTILQEGLATQASKFLVPGEPEEVYIEYSENWLKSCKHNKKEIISGIYPFLNNSSSEIVYKFTMGKGTTNHEREAYFIGWEVVGDLIRKGISYEELAMIKEKDMPEYIRCILNKEI